MTDAGTVIGVVVGAVVSAMAFRYAVKLINRMATKG